MKNSKKALISVAIMSIIFVFMVFPRLGMAEGKVPVTVDTFIRTESDVAIKKGP